jgi:hypothetical protein
VDLGFQVERQEKSNWCWAAVSLSIHKFFKPASARRQCGVAGALLKLPCCGNFTRKCNEPESLTSALRHFARLNRVVQRVPEFGEIQTEINAGRPVCARFEWTTGAFKGFGHFAVVCGFDAALGGSVVIVEDPFYGRSRRPYEQIVRSYQFNRGQWTHTYFIKG